jgi:hypothetical protein
MGGGASPLPGSPEWVIDKIGPGQKPYPATQTFKNLLIKFPDFRTPEMIKNYSKFVRKTPVQTASNMVTLRGNQETAAKGNANAEQQGNPRMGQRARN